jgi:hypothetical protein
MMAALSYGYSTKLNAPVANNGTVTLNWPTADSASGFVDTTKYSVTVGNKTYTQVQAEAAFDGATHKITVTNKSGAAWEQQQDVYVYCPHKFVKAENAGDAYLAIEATLGDHETRIAALETPTP